MPKTAKNLPAPPPVWVYGRGLDAYDGEGVEFVSDDGGYSTEAVIGQGRNCNSGDWFLDIPPRTSGALRIHLPGRTLHVKVGGANAGGAIPVPADSFAAEED